MDKRTRIFVRVSLVFILIYYFFGQKEKDTDTKALDPVSEENLTADSVSPDSILPTIIPESVQKFIYKSNLSRSEQTWLVDNSYRDSLMNLTYESDFTQSGKARLVDGVYREQTIHGSSDELVIRLGDEIALGDLNQDGSNDAAVILISKPGGRGAFYHVAAVLKQNRTFAHVSSAYLGDGIQIRQVEIESSEIHVNVNTALKKYKLDSNRLREIQ